MSRLKHSAVVQPVQVGDRVRKASRMDGTLQGVVIAVEEKRGQVLPVVAVLLDSGSIRYRSLSYWTKI